MQLTPRLLFTVAGLLFAGVVLWPGAHASGVSEARRLVGNERVILFSAEWCGYCDRLRSDLERARVPFVERDIEQSTTNNKAWRSAGGRGVPVTLVGDQVVQGYAPDRVLALARAAP
jgi:mycoredoxin